MASNHLIFYRLSLKKNMHIISCKERLKLTIFPDANINAVVFGSLIRMITAAKRCFQ
jgi:hypothetical protein